MPSFFCNYNGDLQKKILQRMVRDGCNLKYLQKSLETDRVSEGGKSFIITNGINSTNSSKLIKLDFLEALVEQSEFISSDSDLQDLVDSTSRFLDCFLSLKNDVLDNIELKCRTALNLLLKLGSRSEKLSKSVSDYFLEYYKTILDFTETFIQDSCDSKSYYFTFELLFSSFTIDLTAIQPYMTSNQIFFDILCSTTEILNNGQDITLDSRETISSEDYRALFFADSKLNHRSVHSKQINQLLKPCLLLLMRCLEVYLTQKSSQADITSVLLNRSIILAPMSKENVKILRVLFNQPLSELLSPKPIVLSIRFYSILVALDEEFIDPDFLLLLSSNLESIFTLNSEQEIYSLAFSIAIIAARSKKSEFIALKILKYIILNSSRAAELGTTLACSIANLVAIILTNDESKVVLNSLFPYINDLEKGAEYKDEILTSKTDHSKSSNVDHELNEVLHKMNSMEALATIAVFYKDEKIVRLIASKLQDVALVLKNVDIYLGKAIAKLVPYLKENDLLIIFKYFQDRYYLLSEPKLFDELGECLVYLVDCYNGRTDNEDFMLKFLLQSVANFDYDSDINTAHHRLRCLLRPLAELIYNCKGQYDLKKLSFEALKYFRDAWFNLVVEHCHFRSDLAEKNKEYIKMIASKSPIAILEKVTNDFDNDIEFNSILRKKHKHEQKVAIALGLIQEMPEMSNEIRELSFAELAFVSAVALLESSRSSGYNLSEICTYFNERSIQRSSVSKLISSIADMNVRNFINLCKTQEVKSQNIDAVIQDLTRLVSLSYYRVVAVENVSFRCLNHILTALPSLLTIEKITFAIFESLNLIWEATAEQHTNELEFQSSLIPELVLEISDTFTARSNILRKMLNASRAWALAASEEALSSFKGVIQAYLTRADTQVGLGPAMGTSLALGIAKIISIKKSKYAQLSKEFQDFPLNSASDFLNEFTMCQLYSVPLLKQTEFISFEQSQLEEIASIKASKTLNTLKNLSEKLNAKESIDFNLLEKLMRQAAGHCIHCIKCTEIKDIAFESVKMLTSLPFEIMTTKFVDLGISLWTWISSESSELRSLVITGISLNWTESLFRTKGFFDSSYSNQNPFECIMEYKPSDKAEQKKQNETLLEVIRPHSHILRMLRGYLVPLTLFLGSYNCMYLDLIIGTLKEMAEKRTIRHVQARYIHFQVIEFAIGMIMILKDPFEIQLLKKHFLRAALNWFSFPAGWAHGSDNLKVNQEISIMVKICDLLQTTCAKFFEDSKEDLDLLLLLLRHEIFRLRIWHTIFGNEKKFQASQSLLINSISRAWKNDAEIAVYMSLRFPDKLVTLKIRELIIQDPVKAINIPEAAMIMLTDYLRIDTMPLLKHLMFWKPLVPVSALNLFTVAYESEPMIIQYAIRSLRSFPIEVVFFYVPQLVQALRHDTLGYLEAFILETAERSQLFAHQILWNLEANKFRDEYGLEADPMKPKFDKVTEKLLSNMEGDAKDFYEREFSFFAEVAAISGKLRPFIKQPKQEKKEKIDMEIAKIKLCKGVYLPSNPDGEVIDIDRKSGKMLQSHAKAPFMATFIIRKKKEPLFIEDNLKNKKHQTRASNYYEVRQSAIFKVGDDCRQDMLALQLISIFRGIFKSVGADLYVYPYRITPTAAGCGVIDVLPNSVSRDMLGREAINGLYDYFKTNFGDEESINFQKARTEFVQSMAAYSMISYILQFKDRHNGNIMIDDKGHILHIDFGFCFDIGPGGITFENAPFKLTSEMMAVMGGDKKSQPFMQYQTLCVKAFLAARSYSDYICQVVNVMFESGLPCFKGKNTIENLRKRFHLEASEQEVSTIVRKLIKISYENMRTTIYDQFQKLTNGIPY